MAKATFPKERILIVDDDSLLRRLLTLELSRYYEVDEVSCGVDAMERCAASAYAALLVDLEMPEMSGDELVRRLRAQDPRVRAILLTGASMAQDDERLRLFDGYLRKPVADVRAIVDAVAALGD